MSRRPLVGLLAVLLGTLAVSLTSVVSAPSAAAADRDCGDFRSQRDAQIFFLNQGGPHSDPHRLDSDGDGIVCESNPGPYYYGTTPPGGGGGGGGPEPTPQVTVVQSSVSLSLTPSRLIAGESFRMTVTVRPAISRDVDIQRRVDGRWRHFGSGTIGRNGSTSGTFTAPRSGTAFRAVVAPVTSGNRRYTTATSDPRVLTLQTQRVVLRFDDRTLSAGDVARAVVEATPVRPGRAVVLQVRTTNAWRTVERGTFDRRGRAVLTVVPALGRGSYRAVALGRQGAAPQPSGTQVVTVADRTPPPAPYGLVAAAGDASVLLTWSRTTPADFAHHQVWIRTADSSWSVHSVTAGSSLLVDGLQNDVAYSFTVTSVDRSGNRSDAAAVATATPVSAGIDP